MLEEVLGQSPFNCSCQSMIRNHVQKCNSSIGLDNFNIVDRMNNLTDLRILESLYIFKFKPHINESQSAFPLKAHFFYFSIFITDFDLSDDGIFIFRNVAGKLLTLIFRTI